MKKPITINDVLENIIIPMKDDPRLPAIMEIVTQLYSENENRFWFILKNGLGEQFEQYLIDSEKRINEFMNGIDE